MCNLVRCLKDWWNYNPKTFQEEISLARKYVFFSILLTIINTILILLRVAKQLRGFQLMLKTGMLKEVKDDAKKTASS